MTAQTILKMIEEVDPNDKVVLDEIDTRIWCYLNDVVFKKPLYTKNLCDNKPQVYAYRTSIGDISLCLTPRPQEGKEWACRFRGRYTRSRDALKIIRPVGWTFCHVSMEDETGIRPKTYHAGYEKISGETYVYRGGSLLPTEELAELHAIIQAIECERDEKNALDMV